MGGTDITCGISGLPIQTDDPMRFVFLREPVPGYKSSHDHPWACWLPIGLPVKGIYDFYGRVTPSECAPLRKLKAQLVGRYALPLPEDEYTDYGAMEQFPHTIESLMRACERGFLSLEIPGKEEGEGTFKTRVSPFYVSEEMYQACIHNIEDEGKGVSTFRKRLGGLFQRSGDAPGGSLRAAYEWPKRREEMAAVERKHGAGLDDDFLDTMGSVSLHGLRDLTSHIEMHPDILGVGMNNMKPDISGLTALEEFTDDVWEQFEKEATALRVFDATLRYNLRREWYPTLAQGQYHFPDDELLSHRMLARKIEEQAIAIEERYLEKNPEYREERDQDAD